MLVPPAPPTQMLASWQQAVNLVRARSTSLRTATAQSLLAAAETQKALVAFYPTLNAVGSVQRAMISGTSRDASTGNLRNDLPDPATTWNATVSLRQPLLDLGAWHDHRTAELSERAAHERQSDAQRVALGAVASTIVTVVTAERLAEVSRIALSSSLSTLELTQRRAELGASSTVDVLRAQQEVALNRAQVVSATEAVAKSREGLGMALGYAEAWGVSPNVHLDGLAQDAAGICKTVTGVATRADVQAARTQAEISARAIDRSNLTLAPRVDLNSDFTYTTRPVTDNGRPEQWTIGALLTVPLYDGGMRAAARQVASAHAEVAAEELSHTDRQASLEILQADRAVRVASETFQVSVTSRDLAKETARLAELSFVNGKGTNFELVDAQRRAQQAELDLAVKEFEVVKARLTALLARANCTF